MTAGDSRGPRHPSPYSGCLCSLPPHYAGRVTKSRVWTVVGVIAAIVIAWFVVDLLFSLLWLVARLAIVAVVAVIVFFVLRSVFSRDVD